MPLLAISTGLWIGFGLLYIVLLVTLGIMSLRNGHWIMFLIGFFVPAVLAHRCFESTAHVTT